MVTIGQQMQAKVCGAPDRHLVTTESWGTNWMTREVADEVLHRAGGGCRGAAKEGHERLKTLKEVSRCPLITPSSSRVFMRMRRTSLPESGGHRPRRGFRPALQQSI